MFIELQATSDFEELSAFGLRSVIWFQFRKHLSYLQSKSEQIQLPNYDVSCLFIIMDFDVALLSRCQCRLTLQTSHMLIAYGYHLFVTNISDFWAAFCSRSSLCCHQFQCNPHNTNIIEYSAFLPRVISHSRITRVQAKLADLLFLMC